jgi:NADPH:quinone reductase-like Zn-dependent oxidoreductase
LPKKRIQYLHFGAPEELRLDEVKTPDAGKGQIRVEVRAAAVNPMDGKLRRGEMKAISGARFPRGLGHDFAGPYDDASLHERTGVGGMMLTPAR